LRYTRDAMARARTDRETFNVALPRAHDPQRVLHDEERELMRALIASTRETTREENRLLDLRRQQARRALRNTVTAVLLALGLALALVVTATWATTSNIARRRKAQRENEQLQQIVELQKSREEDARLQERFHCILGHDLRNPLTAVLMGASALEYRKLPEPDARIVTRIRSSAERMRRMIEQLLDLTRSRSGGGIRIDRQPLELVTITRRVVEELEMANPGRALQVEVAGETSGEWDPDRLAQVVSNLVGNALHHGCADRPVAVRVDGGASEVALVVHNSGAPIPDELLPVIFEPFRRAQGSKPSGLGLGLFITQQIVLAHDGTIAVASTAEEGTTFTVVLPRRARALACA
jgi:signal transduction histidine kinase